jgi:zinc transport system permease protein
MFDYFGMAFVQHALIAGILASIICGIIGTMVVVRRISMISGSVSHAAFGGIGLGFYLGAPPFLIAAIFTVGVGVVIALIKDHFKEREDTLLGAIWAMGMAVGILLIYQSEGYAADLFGYLFGSVLMVSAMDLYLLGGTAALVVMVVVICFRAFQAITFDESYSTVINLPVTALNIVFFSLISLAVVMLIKVVGVILVVALLTLPAASIEPFCTRLGRMMGWTTLLTAAELFAGLALSIAFDRPTGPVIIVVAFGVYLISLWSRRFA